MLQIRLVKKWRHHPDDFLPWSYSIYARLVRDGRVITAPVYFEGEETLRKLSCQAEVDEATVLQAWAGALEPIRAAQREARERGERVFGPWWTGGGGGGDYKCAPSQHSINVE